MVWQLYMICIRATVVYGGETMGIEEKTGERVVAIGERVEYFEE